MLLWKNKKINDHPKNDHVRLSASPSYGQRYDKSKISFQTVYFYRKDETKRAAASAFFFLLNLSFVVCPLEFDGLQLRCDPDHYHSCKPACLAFM